MAPVPLLLQHFTASCNYLLSGPELVGHKDVSALFMVLPSMQSTVLAPHGCTLNSSGMSGWWPVFNYQVLLT